ncbi:DUF1501 domain-containing protein [Nocardioides marmotae]|uniref:DUF1501 domain-containing protein n=1 Tax=Nocardioides marmotae TaxID=2663857 RepID=UPI0012B65798|nr:DUF1501 domain-containing protein [Nocardioides marmotae]MBC9734082.1 DUF1501 domain-containing protein [Nocardioides marmotae]MTB85185.1 DUF1501 domain-containing protein [Nocardioides marmotae]
MTTPTSTPTPCCEEYAAGRLGRRTLLRSAGLGAALLGATTTTFGSTVLSSAPAAAAEPGAAPWALVVVSLRGAADGLSLVVPHGDPAYYQARPRIAVPAERLLQADAMFGLHPALEPLVPLWAAGRMAAVQATGLPAPNRSHFSAMEEVEEAAPGSRTRSGWLNRLLGTDADTSPLQGLSIGTRPTALVGAEPTMAMSANVGSIRVAGAATLAPTDRRIASLERMWGGRTTGLGPGMRSALDAVGRFAPVRETADPATSYPATDLGRALATVARTVRGDVGSSVFTVDHGDWDMHTDIGSSTGGWLFNNARSLAQAVAAFFADLGPLGDRVTLVTVSEFGRRTVENAEKGLDHGWGNAMLLAGAGVKGGYHGRWPGLTVSGDADLVVTTDYRSVLAEVVTRRTGASTAAVFPGFAPERVGVMAGA